MNEIEGRRAYLAGICIGEDRNFERNFAELQALATACEYEVVGSMVQKVAAVNAAYYMGTGKVQELHMDLLVEDADLLIVDGTLTPIQLRNLQKELDIEILDRTALILEIFAKRARTREARLQVELASLQYMMPRLVGLRDYLGRQGGASGALSNKGAGEKKIELDRRHIGARITECKSELKTVIKDRETQRKQRMKSGLPRAALVGYTNAGKSTIMNGILALYGQESSKQVFEENMLFATLDTSVRRMQLPDHRDFLLSDTVGFIDKLPHQLVEAFQSTLEEAVEADLLLQVVDYADPDAREQIEVTQRTLQELGAGDLPMLILYNKADLVDRSGNYPQILDNKIYLSAKNPEHIPVLVDFICSQLYQKWEPVTFLFPYTEGSAVSRVQSECTVDSLEYLPEGIKIQAKCGKDMIGRYQSFIQFTKLS